MLKEGVANCFIKLATCFIVKYYRVLPPPVDLAPPPPPLLPELDPLDIPPPLDIELPDELRVGVLKEPLLGSLLRVGAAVPELRVVLRAGESERVGLVMLEPDPSRVGLL